MIRCNGLMFVNSGDGRVTVTVYDGVAENAPAVRETVIDAETWAKVAEVARPQETAEKAEELVNSLTSVISESETDETDEQ